MLLHFVRNDGCPLGTLLIVFTLRPLGRSWYSSSEHKANAQLSRCVFRMRELTSLLAFTSPRFTLAVVAVLACLYPLYLIVTSIVDVLMKPLGKRRRWKNGHAILIAFTTIQNVLHLRVRWVCQTSSDYRRGAFGWNRNDSQDETHLLTNDTERRTSSPLS
jgi:hypothetical protein